MINIWFFAAMFFALMAAWVAWFRVPRWIRKGQIHARLSNAGDTDDVTSSFWLTRLANKLTESSLAREDFLEIKEALAATGRSKEQAQLLYLFYCWLIPSIAVFVSFSFLGAMGGLLVAAAGFVLPRRIIRGMGRNAERRQNMEAVELCHLTRMLMEAGISLERAVRLLAVQGRPMIPMLALRLDRFNRLMESGAERTLALDELGENRRIPVLRSYVVLMKQSSQLGAGVSESLEQIIEEAQKIERNRIREETNRIGAKMTVIMMAFMLPALFILIGGPAVVSIGEALTS